jgi:hypothetical protein
MAVTEEEERLPGGRTDGIQSHGIGAPGWPEGADAGAKLLHETPGRLQNDQVIAATDQIAVAGLDKNRAIKATHYSDLWTDWHQFSFQ